MKNIFIVIFLSLFAAPLFGQDLDRSIRYYANSPRLGVGTMPSLPGGKFLVESRFGYTYGNRTGTAQGPNPLNPTDPNLVTYNIELVRNTFFLPSLNARVGLGYGLELQVSTGFGHERVLAETQLGGNVVAEDTLRELSGLLPLRIGVNWSTMVGGNSDFAALVYVAPGGIVGDWEYENWQVGTNLTFNTYLGVDALSILSFNLGGFLLENGDETLDGGGDNPSYFSGYVGSSINYRHGFSEMVALFGEVYTDSFLDLPNDGAANPSLAVSLNAGVIFNPSPQLQVDASFGAVVINDTEVLDDQSQYRLDSRVGLSYIF